jgi:hypothetical protein
MLDSHRTHQLLEVALQDEGRGGFLPFHAGCHIILLQPAGIYHTQTVDTTFREESAGSWLAKFMACKVHGLQSSWLAKFTACKVHGLQSSRLAKFMACKVHGLQSSRLAKFMACKVHGLQSSWLAKS